jgi:hypothetical protein
MSGKHSPSTPNCLHHHAPAQNKTQQTNPLRRRRRRLHHALVGRRRRDVSRRGAAKPRYAHDGPSTLSRDTSTLSSTVNANGKRPLSLAQTAASMPQGTHTDADTGYSWTRQEDQPAWEWRSSRAREEESRALDTILDLGSQIKSRWSYRKVQGHG